MAPYNMIGSRWYHDVIDADPLLAVQLWVKVYCFILIAYLRFFVEISIETDLNISNEINCSNLFRSVNYIGP